MVKVKLPKHSTFTAFKKDKDSPFEKLYIWLGHNVYQTHASKVLYQTLNHWGLPEGYTVDVTKVSICTKDHEMLRAKCFKWAKKKYPFIVDKKLNSEVAMLDLSIGPRVDDTVPQGHAYLEDGWAIKDTRD